MSKPKVKVSKVCLQIDGTKIELTLKQAQELKDVLNDTFGEEVTGRVGATVKLEELGLRVKSTYGTGFKAPSLYQLYAPASPWGAIGNADLNPETSTSWDVGVEQRLADDRVMVGLTYFDSEYEDLIDFVDGYVNQSVATVRGAELAARITLCDALSIGGAYTYTDSEGEEGKDLSRRPRHRASVDIACRSSAQGRAAISNARSTSM